MKETDSVSEALCLQEIKKIAVHNKYRVEDTGV
jgi:hypothetical protein